MLPVNKLPRFIAIMNVSAFILVNLSFLAWYNIPDATGLKLFWIMFYSMLVCLLLGIYAKACRRASLLYKVLMLAFLMRVFGSLISVVFSLQSTSNVDTILCAMFAIKIYLHARHRITDTN